MTDSFIPLLPLAAAIGLLGVAALLLLWLVLSRLWWALSRRRFDASMRRFADNLEASGIYDQCPTHRTSFHIREYGPGDGERWWGEHWANLHRDETFPGFPECIRTKETP